MFGFLKRRKIIDRDDGLAVNVTRANQAQKLEALTQILEMYLGLQKVLICGGDYLPEGKARDAFSLGYMYGCTDAVLQTLSLPFYKKNMTPLEGFLNSAVGRKDAERMFARMLRLAEENDATFMKGVMAGGNDVLNCVKTDGEAAPMGWVGYLRS